MAFKASYSSNPDLAASPAHIGKYCSGITGESVIIAIFTPDSCKTFGVLKVKFLSSIFDLLLKVGPTIAGLSSFAKCSAIKRSEEHTSELQSRFDLVCRLLLD